MDQIKFWESIRFLLSSQTVNGASPNWQDNKDSMKTEILLILGIIKVETILGLQSYPLGLLSFFPLPVTLI